MFCYNVIAFFSGDIQLPSTVVEAMQMQVCQTEYLAAKDFQENK